MPRHVRRVQSDPTPAVQLSRKGVATRARMLEAAKVVFERTGFLDARVTDIADEAGLSHGSFYHYFDSKEQVFREIAEQQEALLTAPTDLDDIDVGDEWDRIRRANRRYLERYRRNGKIMAVIEEVSRYDDQVSAARSARQRHFAERAEKSIRRLQAEGRVDPKLHPGIAAVALGAMVARFAELWLVERWANYRLDVATEQLTRLWANALGLEEHG